MIYNTFCDFRKWALGTMLPIRNIFMSPIPKNRGTWPNVRAVHAQQSFNLKIIAGTLFIHQWTFDKNKIGNKILLNIFFYFPKMGKTVFDLYKGYIMFSSVSLQILLKKHILFQVQPLNILNEFFVCPF